jgi:formylglycine-generating enzyme required for sulfatase activity
VLTASDAMQYAFEGDNVKGEGVQSIFTRTLVRGLETGEADLDGDGLVSLDELYDYVHDRVADETPHQRPGKWVFDVQGQIVIARNPHPVVQQAELPVELWQAIESPFTGVREGAVHELHQLLRGSDPGLVLAAHEALTRLVDDDSRRVSAAAARSLEAYAGAERPGEEPVQVEQRIPDRKEERQGKKTRAPEKPEQGHRSWWETVTQHCGRLLRSQVGPWPAWGWVLGGIAVIALLTGLLSQGWGLWPKVEPTPTPTKTPTVAPTTTATAVPAVVSDTPQPTDTPTPTLAPTATPTPTLTPTTEPTLAAVDTLTRSADGMLMVYVPAGEFLMGDDPVRTVTLDDFWIDRTEVTNAQFAAFLNDRGNLWEGEATWLELNDARCPIKLSEGEFQPKSGYADHPVAEVTWYGASAYCQWVGARLPTEEEWEKAARGTDGREYPWGNWKAGQCNTQEAGVGRTTPVGQYSPGGDSPYGCADMAGNVWEWTSSLWKITRRVSRGGSWAKDRSEARCAASDWDYPSYSITDYGGFRCVSPVAP